MNRPPLYNSILPNSSRTPHLLPPPNGSPLLQRPPHNVGTGQPLIGGPSLLPPPGQSQMRPFNGRLPMGNLMQGPPGVSRLPLISNQNQSMHNRLPAPPQHLLHNNSSGPPSMLSNLQPRMPHLLPPPPGAPPQPMPNKSHLMPNPLLPSPIMNKSLLQNVTVPHLFQKQDHGNKDAENGSDSRPNDIMPPNRFPMISTSSTIPPINPATAGFPRPPLPLNHPANNLASRPPLPFPNAGLMNPSLVMQGPPKIPSLGINNETLKSTNMTEEENDKSKEVWIETKAGDSKVYYYNSKTRETSWTKPDNCVILTHEQYAQQHAKNAQNGDKLLDGKAMLSQLAATPFLPGSIVSGMPPPPWTVQMNQQKMMLIPAEIRLAAAEWSEYQTPEGKCYYFSNKTQNTTWEKPKALTEFEEALKKLNEDEAKVQSAIQEHMNQSSEKKEKPVDKSKPVSSTPITGTPWCIVKTGDQRTFFFNPSTKTSVWQKPKELEGIANIDEIIQKAINGEKSITKLEVIANKPEAELIDLENDANSEKSEDDSKNEVSNLESDVEIVKEQSDTSIESLKRTHEENLDENFKKTKIDEDEQRKQMGITSVEALASKQRESIPLEERIKMFTEMLEEKEVSAFSTWEKELHKIVFDSRYLLLTSKERKQTFEKYTKQRAEFERKEKESKAKKNRQDFKTFIKEQFKCNVLTSKCSFKDFLNKCSDNKEMKLVERTRDREQIFMEALDEWKKREKEKAKEKFVELLKENQKYLHKYSRFSDIKDKIRDDLRYRLIEAVSVREEIFKQFILNLSKKREDDERKDKLRSKEERKLKEYKRPSRSPARKVSKGESRSRKDDSDVDEGEICSSDEDIVSSTLENDDADFKLEKDDFVVKKDIESKLSEEQKKELDKQKRAEESIRARERQVQKELHGHLVEREKHRNLYKQQELVDNFNILLIDLIKNPDYTYHDAKKILKRDHRYEMIASQLSRNEREALFDAHMNSILKKRRKFFIELLEETKSITLNSDWREARRYIKDDPRYQQFSEKRCEKEFQSYLKEKLSKAKSDFRCLLKETKLITYKSRKLIENTDQQHLADIISHLQNDKRYLDLDLFEDERRQLIIDYIEEMAQKGAPPPPTASDPRRK